jgi:beta-galactosidase
MEDVDQSYGYLLYRTQLSGPISGDLVLDELHDYAQVYLNGKLAGKMDRRIQQNHIPLDVPAGKAQLDILVENTGRINFGLPLRGERKGITHRVTLAGHAVEGWQIYSLPMKDVQQTQFQKASCAGPCFYRGTFQVAQPGDTFLDTSHFGKGMLWLNGHPLGRIWDIGPQRTLYVPGPWLKQGENEVVVFDMKTTTHPELQGQKTPVLNGPVARE